MKKNIILVIVILVICTSCKRKEPEDVILSLLNEIPVHEEVMLHDLIIDSNVKVVSDNFRISHDKLGANNYKIKYKYKNKEYTREFVLDIVDKISPFIYSGSTKTIYINNNHDFCEELMFGDNYDSYPKCEIIGNYDNTKLGTYDIKMKVTDQSANETTKNLIIKVIEKPENIPDNKLPERSPFSSVIEKHQGDNISFGIDVSSWQEEIDFNEVKNAGASFVMIRLGYQGSQTKKLTLDKYYKQNIINAKNADLKVGIYLYTDASSIKEAKQHAKWVLDELDNINLDLPIVFDWEDFPNFRKYRISLYELNEMANTFIKTVQDAGYQGMLYSSRSYLENFWENKYNYPVWLAHYTEETTYEGDYLMWQLSNNGSIPGINGAVDINIMYEESL